MIRLILIVLSFGALSSCYRSKKEVETVKGFKAEITVHGTTEGGEEVRLFTLKNAYGLEVQVSEYGALLTSVKYPNLDGESEEITLNRSSLAEWEKDENYLGATIGRYANRIEDGKFSLKGETFELAKNHEMHGVQSHLHGGEHGFDKVVWKGEDVSDELTSGVRLTYRSPDGEEGYPGNLDVSVTYRVSDDDELIIYMEARTDQVTPVNLANHTYWNLSGTQKSRIQDHRFQIFSDKFLEAGRGLIPTGKILPVDGTPFDFRVSRPVGELDELGHPQLELAGGYDHCFVLGEGGEFQLRPVAEVYHPKSGRVMTTRTDRPGVQFYTGNGLEGEPYGKHAGFCLESQAFPNAINEPSFPEAILKPGDVYEHSIVHTFSTRFGSMGDGKTGE